jgi:hypothetical protein
MNAPIQPPAPVNPVISIQPVVASVLNNATGGAPNPLANVPVGTLVEGFVINRDAQNNPILRTSLGDLRVGSEVFLKTGSEVVFRVDAKQADLARILTVDGLTPEEYHAQNTIKTITKDTVSATALQSPLASLAAQAGKAAPATPASGAPVLQAILLQGQPQAATAANPLLTAAQIAQLPPLAQLAQLRAGTPLRLTLLDLKLPPLPASLASLPESPKLGALIDQPNHPAGQPQTLAQPQIQHQNHGTSPAASVEEIESQPELRPLQQSTALKQELTTTVLNQKINETLSNATNLVASYSKNSFKETQSSQPSLPPTAQPVSGNAPMRTQAANTVSDNLLTAAPTQPTNIVTAQVIGHDAEGANILHAPFGSLKLYTTQPLPTGTNLVVQAEVDSHTSAMSTSVSAASSAITEEATPHTGQPLAAIDEVFSWLSSNHPELAQDVQRRLPTLDGSRLTSGLLFFIAAIKNGDIAGVFGKRALRQLEKSVPELLARARQEMALSSTSYADATPTQWATLTIPMLFGQEIQQLKLYVNRDPEDGHTNSTQKDGQRFVLEVTLSELGPMQFDGFVRKSERRRSFDLMVRSNNTLDEALCQTIRKIFGSSMEATGMHGQVIFQSGPQHFFKPPSAPTRPQTGDGMQTILA